MRVCAAIMSTVFLVAFSGLAVREDFLRGKIPNRLCLFGLAGGVMLSAVHLDWRATLQSITGALAGAAILLVPFGKHMVGAGDVKFLAALGSIIGLRLLFPSFLLAAVLGGITAVSLIVRNERTLQKIKRRVVLMTAGVWKTPPGFTECGGKLKGAQISGAKAFRFRSEEFPYSLPISIGALIVNSFHLFKTLG